MNDQNEQNFSIIYFNFYRMNINLSPPPISYFKPINKFGFIQSKQHFLAKE